MQTQSDSGILILGGKQELIVRVSSSRFARKVGWKRHYAGTIASALLILEKENKAIKQIIIEAFMDNSEKEDPFQFLDLLNKSKYADIPVLVAAGEPGPVGISLLHCVERTSEHFGAEFVLLPCFDPDDVNFFPIQKLSSALFFRA